MARVTVTRRVICWRRSCAPMVFQLACATNACQSLMQTYRLIASMVSTPFTSKSTAGIASTQEATSLALPQNFAHHWNHWPSKSARHQSVISRKYGPNRCQWSFTASALIALMTKYSKTCLMCSCGSNWAFNVDANSGHAFGILLAAVGALRPCGAPAPVN